MWTQTNTTNTIEPNTINHGSGEMNSRSGARRFFPGHRNRKPLQKESFATVEERNRYIIEKRQAGHTLQAIGDSVGLTREMIRQILVAKGGPTKTEVKKSVENQIQEEVLAAFHKKKVIDAREFADELGIDQSTVKKALGPKAKKLIKGRKHHKKYFSDEDLLQILRDAEARVDGPLTTNKYQKLKVAPTVAVFIARFGSWKEACKLAGVESGKVVRNNYTRAHSEEDMHGFVASYLADPRTNGSAEGYEKWQRNVDGAPSLSLIRQRIGKWNEIKARLMNE
jgi:Homing endonuclease associated repeat